MYQLPFCIGQGQVLFLLIVAVSQYGSPESNAIQNGPRPLQAIAASVSIKDGLITSMLLGDLGLTAWAVAAIGR